MKLGDSPITIELCNARGAWSANKRFKYKWPSIRRWSHCMQQNISIDWMGYYIVIRRFKL